MRGLCWTQAVCKREVGGACEKGRLYKGVLGVGFADLTYGGEVMDLVALSGYPLADLVWIFGFGFFGRYSLCRD